MEARKGHRKFKAIRNFLDKLSEIPLVEELHIISEKELLDFWVIIAKKDLQTELKISKAFAELLRSYSDINLDFLILPREEK